MRMLAVGAAAMLAACASPPPSPPASPSAPAPAAAPAATLKSLSLDDYKRALAGRIVASSPKLAFHDSLPSTMKSIVVLHIRLDRRGRPTRVAVFRSNGYPGLEQRAVASVVGASPVPPPDALLDDTSSLSFLETFLFRDDGRFQVRSLVP